jgi:uncharacterized protein YigA (DUF484 family)
VCLKLEWKEDEYDGKRMNMKRRVIATITRTVKQVMEVTLDNDDFIEEIHDVREELSSDNEQIETIQTVISEW